MLCLLEGFFLLSYDPLIYEHLTNLLFKLQKSERWVNTSPLYIVFTYLSEVQVSLLNRNVWVSAKCSGCLLHTTSFNLLDNIMRMRDEETVLSVDWICQGHIAGLVTNKVYVKQRSLNSFTVFLVCAFIMLPLNLNIMTSKWSK